MPPLSVYETEGGPVGFLKNKVDIIMRKELKLGFITLKISHNEKPDEKVDKTDLIKIAKDKISKNISDIESRTDLSADEKVKRVIKIFSAACAGVAVQPIPFADIFVLTPLQAYMAERLASVRGVPISNQEATETVKDLFKVIGLGMVAQQVALGLYKIGLPFLAGFTTMPLVYGLTYSIGTVLDRMFIVKAKGGKLTQQQMKQLWNQEKKFIKKRGKEFEGE